MAESFFPDDPQTVQRLDSVACLLEWVRSMPASVRMRFFVALAECSDAAQQVIVGLLGVIKNPGTTRGERQRALKTIASSLFPDSDECRDYVFGTVTTDVSADAESPSAAREVQKLSSQAATFAQRLREVMEAKRISQQELADRIGCSQPAISQMLGRNCRPQRQTILKLAEALNVQAPDLWPDIEVIELLDAAASFQQDDYVMTEAEACALGDTLQPNRPKIPANPAPARR